ncbi:NBAS subunit of NRZ tethering complex-like [Adelges cooleyi]|uniref:NBAS subunit of NRZ tethering complex-like n=1 Tax=Adelges cooleyi TaxID=133065 RepID=UPI002180714D|nr:NBAS subunit of NRZ tethering complex-like [Adelges cooleyi]
MTEKVLYIVSDYIEWYEPVDLKKVSKKPAHSITDYFGAFQYFPYFSGQPYNPKEPVWKFCIGGNGQVLAVVQQSTLEMRTEKHYNKTLAKASLPDIIADDLYPSKRILAWSPDCSIFAIATSQADIACYDLLASNLFVIESASKNNKQSPNDKLAKEMVFLDLRTKSSKWSYELILIGGNGSLTSYAVSSVYGYQIQHTFNFIQILNASLLTSVTLCSDPAYVVTSSDVHNKLDLNDSGLNVWSMISYEPYYSPVLASNIQQAGFMSRLVNVILHRQNKFIVKMSLSPSAANLACLYGTQNVCIWNFPKITLSNEWCISDQKEWGGIIDISWWCDEILILGCFDGTLVVCNKNGQQSIVNTKMNSTFYKLCGTYNSDNFVVADFKLTESSNISQDASIIAKPVTTYMYKLIAVTKTTPQQLLIKKIQLKEYEEALDLAIQYDLDKDLVYKHQWRDSLVLEDTITGILSKVSDKKWIVQECCYRVSDSLLGAKQLLEYGLEITDFSAYLNIETGNCKTSDSISEMGKEFVTSRLKLLEYTDKLSTYEKILRKMEGDSNSLYKAQTYTDLRDLSPLQWAMQLAQQCQVDAVSIVITYYSENVLPYWLDVLSEFPETLMPRLYRHLLPVWDSSTKQVLVPESKTIRELDWCESDRFKLLTNTFQTVKPMLLTENDLIFWYTKRIRDIESSTKLVQHTLELATIAIENNIKELEQLHEDLSILEVLVYEVGLDYMYLKDIEQLTTLEKAKLFMLKCDENNFLHHLSNYFLPYIQSKPNTFYLLEQYLIETSQKSLKKIAQFFEYTQLNGWCISGVTDEAKISLGLLCIYTYTESDQLDEALSIVLSLMKTIKNTTNNKPHMDKLNDTKQIINASKLLLTYGINYSLKKLLDNISDPNFYRSVMISVCDYTSIKNQTDKYWSNVLGDLLKIKELCFSSLSTAICYEEYAKKLLFSNDEKIMVLCTTILKDKLPDEICLQLIKDTFAMYFDRSKSFNDSVMGLAKLCLTIVPDIDEYLTNEWNFVTAMTIFNNIGTKILPIQVRNCKNKWKLIDISLSSKPKNYTLSKKLVTLAHKLGITVGEDFTNIESCILFKCAMMAYNANDIKFASKTCVQLMEKDESPVWSLCYELGKQHEIIDINLRKKMLSYAVLNCPADKVVSIVNLRKLLEDIDIAHNLDNDDSELKLPKIENLNYFAVSNYESSMHFNCSNCVEVMPSRETLKSNLHDLQLLCSKNDSPNNFNKALAIYGFKCLGHDSQMSILCYLNITSDDIVDQCFENCNGILSIKLALYIFALRYAIQVFKETELLHEPTDRLIKRVMSHLDNVEPTELVLDVVKYIRKYALLYSKCAKKIDLNVNTEDLNKELIRMAKTGKLTNLEKALEICDRQSLDINDKLLVEFLKCCLFTVSARKLEENLELLEFNTLIKNTEEFHSSIVSDIYEDIPGINHNVLIAYYTALNLIYPDDRSHCKDLTPKEHIKLLKRVHSTIPDIDYKLLLSPDTAYETFNVAQQAGCSGPVMNRLLKSLPDNIQQCIKLSCSASSSMSDISQESSDVNQLFQRIESPADIDKIVKLLPQSNESNGLWVEAMKRLLSIEPQEYKTSITILKYTCNKHTFNKEELENLNDVPNVNRTLLSLLYLISGESAVETMAVNYFQSNHDLPDLVLDTILEYGLMEQLINCREIVENLSYRALTGNNKKNCRLVCEQLTSNKQNQLAGALYLAHNGVPAALKTNVAAREIAESYLARNSKDK